MAWYADDEAAEAAFARSHGPDALVIAADDLADRLARTTRGIKPTLMDQKVLAGIGNIYADETLFRSRIHPERPADVLTRAEVDRLHAAIGSVLAEAIEAEGSSFDAGYKTVWGGEGGFLNQNAMYGRGGKPCPGVRRAGQQGQDRRPDRPPDALLPDLPDARRRDDHRSSRRRPAPPGSARPAG